MPKFAANLSWLFTELPFMKRFEAAAKAGFQAVEFLFPYGHGKKEIARELQSSGLTVALFNLPPGDFANGERGLAALPGREKEFLQSARLAVDYALALGCRKLHAMSGIVPPGAARDTLKPLWLSNMRAAADIMAEHGITLLCEALNHRDNPGYYLLDQRETAALAREIGKPNARLQLDIYHAQITHGDLSMLIRSLKGGIGHVQIASVPGRNEPDGGEIDYVHILRELKDAGYTDWIGCEYAPKNGTLAGLGWLANFEAALAR